MVYIDNDNMDDIEILPRQHSFTNGSSASASSYYDSSNLGMENPYSFEWDETIDYDYYEKRSLNKTKRLTDLQRQPKNTIVLVQERRHRNGPITNVIYRYGDLNQRTFALPKKSTFQKYRPLRFHPSFVDTSLTFSNHVNMLINPTYLYETLRRFMPKETVFIAVLHDPVKSFIVKLIKHPLLRKYKLKRRLNIMKKLVKRNKVFGDKFVNSIAFEFGKYGNHNLTTEEMINRLKNQFHVVLMGEYLDESLVVLKNVLNWSLTDLVHVSKRINIDYTEIPSQIQDAIKKHNKLDQAIYDHFNSTFWKTVESYGLNFTADLKKFQSFNQKLANYCRGSFGNLTNTEGHTVCTRMKWGDKEYVPYLKQKYQVMSNMELNSGLQYLRNSLELYFNTTTKEIQRYLES